jgi:hypothetical protein
MKANLFEVANAHNSLVAIQKANDIPVLMAWDFGNWLVELAPIAARFHEQEEALAKKYGKPDPKNSQQYIVQPAKISQFQKEYDKLKAIEVDLNGQTKLKLPELKEIGINIPPAADLIAIRLFIQ